MAKAKKRSTTKSRAKARFKSLRKSGEIGDVKELISEGGFEGVKGTGRKGKVKRRDVKSALLSDEQRQYFERRDKEQVSRDKEAAVKKAAQAQIKPKVVKKTKVAKVEVQDPAKQKKMKELEKAAIRGNKNKTAREAAKKGEIYVVINPDGTKSRVIKGDEKVKRQKSNILKHGGKVKAFKKAPGGAAMKKMPEYEKGGALKSVPSDAKGLSKLPKGVRNKMGYAKHGSKVKAMYGAKMKKK